MKKKNLLFTIVFLFCLTSYSTNKDLCNFFLVKQTGEKASIERVTIEENRVKVFNDPDIITFILPVSPGKAGDLIQEKNRNGAITVQFRGGKLYVKSKFKDGREYKQPLIDINDLKKYSIRVSITGGNGFKKAYRIENYNELYEDMGPVLDIFAGRIPLGKKDFSITIETDVVKNTTKLNGIIPFRHVKNWTVVEAKLPNMKKGLFVVDYAATGSVISKETLPPNAKITELKTVSYSTKGKQVGRGVMFGANGKVENFLGKTTLSNLKIADLKIDNVYIGVLDNFPELDKENKIIGILGNDIL